MAPLTRRPRAGQSGARKTGRCPALRSVRQARVLVRVALCRRKTARTRGARPLQGQSAVRRSADMPAWKRKLKPRQPHQPDLGPYSSRVQQRHGPGPSCATALGAGSPAYPDGGRSHAVSTGRAAPVLTRSPRPFSWELSKWNLHTASTESSYVSLCIICIMLDDEDSGENCS